MERRIIWKKHKNGLSLEQIEMLLNKYKELEIVNMPINNLDYIFGKFDNFSWKIFDDVNDETPINLNLYYETRNYNAIHYYHKQIHYITMDLKDKEGEVILE